MADDLEAYLGEVLIGGLEPGAIVLAPHDPAWAARFRREAAIIRQALGSHALAVEHVGSTAVPGLVAKPIIDILVVVEDSSREETYLPALEAAGYVLRVREPAFYEHRMLRTPGGDVHVHVYPVGSPEIGRMLWFRDHLRRSAGDRRVYAETKQGLASRQWKSMQYYAEAKTPVIERILARRGDQNREPLTRLIAPALVGLLVFVYQVPLAVVAPANIQWLMKADRSGPLAGWLFERNEPWTLPFGILHTMIAPLVMTVGYSDALPVMAVPAKLFFGWVSTPWQYCGVFLLVAYMLQGVFGYLVLRALGVRRGLSILGAAFFATSPALLHRFEHVSLSAHWELLAAWWLYLRPPPPGRSWRVLVPWLVLLAITIPTHAYLALMAGGICGAAYVRAVWADRILSWRTAAWHAVVGAATVAGVFWIFGYFVVGSLYDSGFGRFSADLLAFFNSAGLSAFLPPIRAIGREYDNFYYLGFGMILLLPYGLACGLAMAARARPRAATTPGAAAPSGWPPLWPGVLAAAVMFAYALSTPVRFAGHPVIDITAYSYIAEFTGWFRGSGRFAWPIYYLVIALTLAAIARSSHPALAYALLGAALVMQVADMRVLRVIVQREYTRPRPRLESPAWEGLGRSFRSVRLVPPIIAHQTACHRYDRPNDYEIRFGVMAAEQGMAFNSAYPARIDVDPAWCQPMIDSLGRGEMDPSTVYIPSATYREAIEWWAAGRAVCGTIEDANVCVARPDSGAAVAPITRLLLQQEPVPPPIVLHADMRRGEPAAIVDSTAGFEDPDSSGRTIGCLMDAPARGIVYFNRAMPGSMTLVVQASVAGVAHAVPVTVTFGTESRALMAGPGVTTDTLRFAGAGEAQMLSFVPVRADVAPAGTGAARPPPEIRIRRLVISLDRPAR